MKKSLIYVLLAMVLVMVTAPFVFAAKEVAQAAPAGVLITQKQL